MTTETLPAVVKGEERDPALALDRVIVAGDLSKLSPTDRVIYYRTVCESIGLNPFTKPFEYINLSGKLTLYATKTATDQLRSLRSISIDSAERDGTDADYATWLVTGHDSTGRTDMEIGSVHIAGLKGEARANAIMKALTKGKRRLTLSLSGLGWLDETEVGSVPSAEVADVDMETGEIHRTPSLRESISDRRAAITSGPVEPPRAATRAEGGGASAPPEPPHPALDTAPAASVGLSPSRGVPRHDPQEPAHAAARTGRDDTEAGNPTAAPPDAGRTPPSRRAVSPAAPEPEGPRDTAGPAIDAEGQSVTSDPSDEAGSVGQSGDQPADSARLLCGAIPPESGLGLSEPCILAAGSPHKAHRSEQGTWPT